jgi:hypothetical protein
MRTAAARSIDFKEGLGAGGDAGDRLAPVTRLLDVDTRLKVFGHLAILVRSNVGVGSSYELGSVVATAGTQLQGGVSIDGAPRADRLPEFNVLVTRANAQSQE